MRVGTAGWTVSARDAAAFPSEGTSLERYTSRFRCAEINSSFHRSHRESTWARWGACVPEDFRFSAKLPKTITHKQKLVDCDGLLAATLDEMAGLGEKLAVLLVQLPPSLAFDSGVAEAFFAALRGRGDWGIACEPRHPSWFEAEPGRLLADHEIGRVAADPARVEAAAVPGGWPGLVYYRLHGSPAVYRSSYDDGRLEAYAERLSAEQGEGRDVWCIFDNTASSAATGDALKLSSLLEAMPSP